MTQRRFSPIITIRSKNRPDRGAGTKGRQHHRLGFDGSSQAQVENRQMITSFKVLPSVVLAALAPIVSRDYPNR
jgi:hypothetical protein